jgi:hypothetical protein
MTEKHDLFASFFAGFEGTRSNYGLAPSPVVLQLGTFHLIQPKQQFALNASDSDSSIFHHALNELLLQLWRNSCVIFREKLEHFVVVIHLLIVHSHIDLLDSAQGCRTN